MKININYPQLAAEFVIVFVGVAVALAADEWRQDLQNKDLERNYLVRLEADIRQGRGRILIYKERFDSVQEAASELISFLDSKEPLPDTNYLFDLATQAGQSGTNQNDLAYDAIYQELLATGNLSIIRDSNLRTGIVNHFREASGFVEEVAELPLNYSNRTKSITSYNPGAFVTGRIEPTQQTKERLAQELINNEQLQADLRHFHAELGQGRIFESAIESIDSLLEIL